MTNIINEEVDPLAELVDQEKELTETKITIESSETNKKQGDYKYYEVFKSVENDNASDLNISQRLPNILATDEDLEECLKLCEEQFKLTSDNQNKLSNINDVVESFYQISVNTYGREFERFFSKNVNRLVQYAIGAKGEQIRISYPSLTLPDNDSVLSGKAATRYLSKITKTGNTTKIPLWHSGIVITIDPFSETEMLDLNIELSRNQLEIGSKTRGASFTGDDIYVVGTLIDFILPHVVSCNLTAFDRTNLSKIILSNDIPALFAGALASIYPAGYPVIHSCLNKELGLCDYNLTANRKDNNDYYPDSLLDFTKILWVDKSLLTIEDLDHMSLPAQSIKYEDIKAYQKKLLSRVIGDNNRVEVWKLVTDNRKMSIDVGFKVPTLAEYSKTATTWVNSVERMAEAALAKDTTLLDKAKENKRIKLLNSYARTNELVKHLGWIEYILVTEEDGTIRTINDEKTIKEALENFIQLETFKEKFEEAARVFKENSIIAWTGFPNFKCPVCGSGQTNPESRNPSLIPINMTGYFFSIMAWRKQMRHGLV
jgi:hypothetical protein